MQPPTFKLPARYSGFRKHQHSPVWLLTVLVLSCFWRAEATTMQNLGGSGCHAGNRCTECQADCDYDSDCADGLKCMERNALEAVPGCTPGGSGDYSSYDYCYRDNTMQDLGASGCHAGNRCTACQGDCDIDSDCADGLKCMERNALEAVPGCTAGGAGDVSSYDYCYQPTTTTTTITREAPFDSSYCLQQSSSNGWGPVYNCGNSLGWCNSWPKDVQRCCSLGCGNQVLTEAECNALSGGGACDYPIPRSTTTTTTTTNTDPTTTSNTTTTTTTNTTTTTTTNTTTTTTTTTTTNTTTTTTTNTTTTTTTNTTTTTTTTTTNTTTTTTTNTTTTTTSNTTTTTTSSTTTTTTKTTTTITTTTTTTTTTSRTTAATTTSRSTTTIADTTTSSTTIARTTRTTTIILTTATTTTTWPEASTTTSDLADEAQYITSTTKTTTTATSKSTTTLTGLLSAAEGILATAGAQEVEAVAENLLLQLGNSSQASVTFEDEEGNKMTASLILNNGEEQEISVPGSPVSVAIPADVAALLPADAAMVIAAFGEEAAAKFADATPDVLGTPPVSVRIVSAMSGGEIVLPGGLNIGLGPSSVEGARCAFWDENKNTWESGGLVTVMDPEKGIVCETPHLTIFSAILFVEELERAIKCANLKVLSGENLANLWKGTWWSETAAIILWTYLGVFCILLCYVLWYDRNVRKSSQWSDENLLTSNEKYKNYRTGLRSKFMNAARRNATKKGIMRQVSEMSLSSKAQFDERFKAVMVKEDSTDTNTKKKGFLKKSKSTVTVAFGDEDIDDIGTSDALPKLNEFISKNFIVKSWVMFSVVHPILQVTIFNVTISSATRMLMVGTRVLGALMLSCLWFDATGAAFTLDSDTECKTEDFWREFVRSVVVGFLSVLVSDLPLQLFAFIHRRDFVYAENWDEKKKRKQLRFWMVCDCLQWSLSLAYSAFSVLFIASFLANVDSDTASNWVVSTVTSVGSDLILNPVLSAVFYVLVFAILIRIWPNSFENVKKDMFGKSYTQRSDSAHKAEKSSIPLSSVVPVDDSSRNTSSEHGVDFVEPMHMEHGADDVEPVHMKPGPSGSKSLAVSQHASRASTKEPERQREAEDENNSLEEGQNQEDDLEVSSSVGDF